jgi:hypothetical protein
MADGSRNHWTEIPPIARAFQGPSTGLSVHRAFVVHLGTAAGPRRRFHGRVEHLTSGRTAHFSSLAQLLGFVTTILGGSDPSNPPAEVPSARRRRRRTRTVGRSR